MTEYLIAFAGKLYIARVGVAKWHVSDNEEILQPVWCERDGAVICGATDTDFVNSADEILEAMVSKRIGL